MTALPAQLAADRLVEVAFRRAMDEAARALGALSGEIVTITEPEIRRGSAADILALAGGPEQVVLAVYAGIAGALDGHALLILPPDDAHRLAAILLLGLLGPGELPIVRGGPFEFDELETSALQEAGNVTISAFLNELGRGLAAPVQPTVPQVVVEMAGAVLDAVLSDLLADRDDLLASRTTFVAGARRVEGTLLVLPRAGSLDVLLASISGA
ncbi:MAG TPA: hypothetical protein VF763_12880 [Candidatus Limnocylindrales bacterium]